MFGKRGKKFSLFKHVWTGLKFRSTTRKDSLITLHVLVYYHLVRGSFFFVHCKAKNTVQLSVSHSKSLSFLIGLLDHRGSLPKTSPKVSPITMSFEYKLQPRLKLLRQFHLFSNFCALLPSPLNTKSKPPPHPLFKVALV